MGMFDSFFVEEPIVCPKCKKGKLNGFQTKALDCVLDEYRIGDRVQALGIKIIHGSIHVYRHCRECKTMIYGEAVIDQGIFTGITNFSWDVNENE